MSRTEARPAGGLAARLWRRLIGRDQAAPGWLAERTGQGHPLWRRYLASLLDVPLPAPPRPRAVVTLHVTEPYLVTGDAVADQPREVLDLSWGARRRPGRRSVAAVAAVADGVRPGRRMLVAAALAALVAVGSTAYLTTGPLPREVNVGPRPTHTTLAGHTGPVTSVAFSPDGRTLASGSRERSPRLWDVATGRTRGGASAVGAVTAVAVSPTGRLLATGDGGSVVVLWALDELSRVTRLIDLTGHAGRVTALAFSPDGHTLAVGGDDETVRLWNVLGGSMADVPVAVLGPVTSLAFSPDGRLLAVGARTDQAGLWNVADPAHPELVGSVVPEPVAHVASVAFSPDGRTLATGDVTGQARLWNVADPSRVGPARGAFHVDGAVSSLAFSPDGRTLAVGGSGGLRVWRLVGGASRRDPWLPSGFDSPVASVAFSPDGRTLAAASGDLIHLWRWG